MDLTIGQYFVFGGCILLVAWSTASMFAAAGTRQSMRAYSNADAFRVEDASRVLWRSAFMVTLIIAVIVLVWVTQLHAAIIAPVILG